MGKTKGNPDYSTLTSEELIAELTASQKAAADNAALAKAVEEKRAELENELNALKLENEALTKVNDELTITVETLTKELEGKKTIQDVARELEEKKLPPLPTSTFTVAGKSYRFISPVAMYKKTRIVAAEAINNQELLNELVEAKVGIIKEA